MYVPFRRAGLWLAALMLLASVGFPPEASAAEETDPYVLQYMPSQLPVAYDYVAPYFYVSPFAVRYTLTGKNGRESAISSPRLFNLINITRLQDGGEGPYASIAAYSLSVSPAMEENTGFRRVNLEDSGYFTDTTAQMLRAVVLNAFPRKNLIALQVRANFWLRRVGLPEIVDLQSGEAVLAAQAAIWKLANGENMDIQSLYGGISTPEEGADAIDPDMPLEQETKYTAQNVVSLYNFLYNLEPEEPRYSAASGTSLENPSYTAVKEPDDTYTVTVAVTVNTTVSKWDSLVLSAVCGEKEKTQTVARAGEYCFTFQGLPDCFDVELELNGQQYGADVYLFQADGQTELSQILLGYDSGIFPVHGEMTVSASPEAAELASKDGSNHAGAGLADGPESDGVRLHMLSAGESSSSGTGGDRSVDDALNAVGTLLSLAETAHRKIAVVNVAGVTVLAAACLLLFSNRNRKA